MAAALKAQSCQACAEMARGAQQQELSGGECCSHGPCWLSHHVQPTSQRGSDLLHVSHERPCMWYASMHLTEHVSVWVSNACPSTCEPPGNASAPQAAHLPSACSAGDSPSPPTANSQQPGAPLALPTWSLLMVVRVVAATPLLSADSCCLAWWRSCGRWPAAPSSPGSEAAPACTEAEHVCQRPLPPLRAWHSKRA